MPDTGKMARSGTKAAHFGIKTRISGLIYANVNPFL